MKTFDYRRAWHEVAKPAYLILPADVRQLLADVTEQAKDLHQLPDCSMPWPEDSDLRARFDRIPAEWLALAARAIYFVGHWRPADADLAEIPRNGETWKFAHYADQSLRERLGLPPRGSNGRYGSGCHSGVEIHQGTIRVYYSSPDCWLWDEVAPATQEGLRFAHARAADITQAITAFTTRRETDNAAYARMETIKTDRRAWDARWLTLIDTEKYMVEESEIVKAAESPYHTAKRLAAKRAEIVKRTADKIAALKINEAGTLWLIDHGLETDNAIYYAHTGRWCFGWRTALTPSAISKWLDVLAEFPYDYDIKGYTPQKV